MSFGNFNFIVDSKLVLYIVHYQYKILIMHGTFAFAAKSMVY